MKTYAPKASEIERKWHLIDASGQTLGRMSAQIAKLLIGKHKAMFAPNTDTGDFVVVINAVKVKVTGKKMTDKIYYRVSGYPGGIRAVKLGQMLEKHPERVIEHAVRGMLPNSRLGRTMYKKLKVYAGGEHPHEAQLAAVKESDKGSSGK
jgi:large subunit ribosomal protein L13